MTSVCRSAAVRAAGRAAGFARPRCDGTENAAGGDDWSSR